MVQQAIKIRTFDVLSALATYNCSQASSSIPKYITTISKIWKQLLSDA